MGDNLTPIPAPGLCLFPDFVATKAETYFMKPRTANPFSTRCDISVATPDGKAGTLFLRADEDEHNKISFKTPDGREVMKIIKKKHHITGRGPEYDGLRGDGTNAWYLKIHRGLLSNDYKLTIFPMSGDYQTLDIKNKVLGQDKGILYNGSPVATMSQHDEWGHLRREDLVHVAPGMDIMLAIGICWIRSDKESMAEEVFDIMVG